MNAFVSLGQWFDKFGEPRSLSPLRGSIPRQGAVTQGSQSPDLSLTVTAALQLVGRSRLTHYHQRLLFCYWVFQVSDLLCEPLLTRGLLTSK